MIEKIKNMALKDCGVCFLRLVVGIIFFVHGAQKLFGWFGGFGIEGTAGFLHNYGFPIATFFAWVLALVEFFGGVTLILGFMTQIMAILLAIDMLVAIFLVHWAGGFFVQNGGVEYVFLLFASLVTIIFLGAGRYSFDQKILKTKDFLKSL